jgi:hypothetical protein
MTKFRQNFEKQNAQRRQALELKRQAIVNLLPDIARDIKKKHVSSILIHE